MDFRFADAVTVLQQQIERKMAPRRVLVIVGLLLLAASVLRVEAQTPAAKPDSTAAARPDTAAAGSRSAPAPVIDVEAQRAAMQRLAFMVGKWQGEGWMESGGERHAFRGGEVVQEKLGGLTLLVEGTFWDVDNPIRRTPVHATLGVISAAPPTSNYRFLTWLANGRTGEQELVLRDKGWAWDIEFPGGAVRYTMQLKRDDEWFEIGERTADGGQTWNKFFEMTLRKEPPAETSK